MRKIALVLAIIVTMLLLAGGGIALEILSRKHAIPVRSTTHARLGRRDCIGCHAPIAEEWRQSFHARSLTGPNWKLVRELGYADIMARFRKPCVNCHAPANVLDLAASGKTGELGVECTPNLLREPPGIIPSARVDDVALGVDCTSCHVSAHGVTGAGRTRTAAHEIIADRRFQDAMTTSRSLCRTCHRATVEAWEKTPLPGRGVTCVDCHMPQVRAASVAGGPDRLRRSHRFVADKDDVMLRGAFHATLDLAGARQARFRIANHGAGHYFPSGGNFVIVRFTMFDPAGRKVDERVEMFGKEEALLIDFRTRDDRIAYGERKEVLIPLPDGHGRIEAAIRYHDFMKAEKTLLTLQERY